MCPSDGLRHRGQAELGPRGLELRTALILYRRGPGRHRGIPAGALAGGPACAHVLVTSGKHGAADAFLPQCQDHRLARLERNRRRDEDVCLCIWSGVCVCPAVNSWSGQHPYRWHCGSHAPHEDCEDRTLRLEWPSQPDKEWVSAAKQVLKHEHQRL